MKTIKAYPSELVEKYQNEFYREIPLLEESQIFEVEQQDTQNITKQLIHEFDDAEDFGQNKQNLGNHQQRETHKNTQNQSSQGNDFEKRLMGATTGAISFKNVIHDQLDLRFRKPCVYITRMFRLSQQ